MPTNYEVITFDCYGTLIDWERGIGDAFQAAAQAAGIEVERERVLGIYHEVEPQIQAAAFRPYRAVLAETAQRVAEYVGWIMDGDAAQEFAASLPDWPPFSDTDAALNQMAAAGYALGIPVVWVNRQRETIPPDGPKPLDTVLSVTELAEWLTTARR